MTIEKTLDRINELKALKNEYLNMLDICSFSDMLQLDDINSEIRSLQTQLKYNIEYFVEKTCNGYHVGYKYFNGYRIVNVYVRTLYAGRVLYTLDYTRAKDYTTKHYAMIAQQRVIEYNNNNPDRIRTN